MPVVSRADAAAANLVWISKGSHKSRGALRQIYRTSSESDCQRVRELVEQLSLTPFLDEILNEPDEVG